MCYWSVFASLLFTTIFIYCVWTYAHASVCVTIHICKMEDNWSLVVFFSYPVGSRFKLRSSGLNPESSQRPRSVV